MSDIPERGPVTRGLNPKACGIPPKTPKMRGSMGRRYVNAMLLLAALALSHPAARAQGTEPPYLVIDFDWVDQSRSRPVPARLYWPTGTVPNSSVPLVVFSHGIGGSRQGYSYLGKYWSARGVASLHVQHVGSDVELWRATRSVWLVVCRPRLRKRRPSHVPAMCASRSTECSRTKWAAVVLR